MGKAFLSPPTRPIWTRKTGGKGLSVRTEQSRELTPGGHHEHTNDLRRACRVADDATTLTTSAHADQTYGVDDGTHITMWSRAATQPEQTHSSSLQRDAQEPHRRHIRPHRRLPDQGRRRGGRRRLPDLFSADVVFMPNWTSAGLFPDLTDRIATLPFAENIAQGAINVSTWNGKKYGLPFVVDLSVWMYNKKLFKAAGLDPASRQQRWRSSRPTPVQSPSSAAMSTAPSSAATAAAAKSSPGSRSHGPTARR